MVNNPYGPSGGSANNPYGPTTPGYTPPPAPTPKSVASAKAQQTQNKALPPIFGLGQGILKGLLTSGAGSIELLDGVIKGAQNPSIMGGGRETLENAGRNIATLWGPKDVFEPGAWDKLKTGEDVLRDRFGVTDPTALFWGGLAVDIFADPLTYVPVVNVLSAGTKATAAFGRAAIQGGKLAAAREVSEKLAQRKVGEPVKIVNEFPVGTTKKLQKEGLQTVRQNIIKVDPKAADFVTKAEKILANNVYKTTRVTDPRTLSQAARDTVASALDAGVKAAVNSFTSTNLTKFLDDYARRDVKLFGRGIVANVVRNSDSGAFDVVSGNKVKLGEAATKAEAQLLAKRISKGLETATAFAPAPVIAGARQVTKEEAPEAAESVVIPTAEGAEVTLETYVPHQADNGKTYVYDGKNVAEFDNVADAQRWVEVSQAPEVAEEVTPAVVKSGKGYVVTVGESVTRFKTKKEADAYAASVRTGEIPTAARVTSGGTPVLDVPAPMVPVKEAIKVPTKKEASALKKVLQGIDDIAKKASGFRPLVNKSVAKQISQILSKTQAQLDNFLITLDNQQLSAMKAFIAQDLSAKEFFALLNDTTKGTKLANVIRTLPVETSKGSKTFGELLDAADGNFLNISKANEPVEGTGLEAQILKALNVRFYQRAQQLKTKTVLPASDPEGRYQAIVAVAGEKIADKIKATGYLAKPTTESEAKVKEILREISIGGTEVSYQGYDDLIAGLQRGDSVSANVLDEILTKIDPEGSVKAQVVQAAAEPAQAYLTRLLTREGGVDTIYEAERRLALANDPAMIAKHANLAYDAEVNALMNMAVKGDKAMLNSVEFANTRQKAAETFAQYPTTVQRDAMDSLGRSIGERSAYKASILEEATGEIRVSTLGDEIYSTGEAYADGSRAMFSKQLQQSDEVVIAASILGKRGWRADEAKKLSKVTGKQFEELTGDEKIEYFIQRMSAVRDGATALGFRFVRSKNRSDISFQRSYTNALAKAKETNTTPNFSALAEKHTAYLPMADIFETLRDFGGSPALIKAFFPTGKVNITRDTLDFYGIGDAARRVLEMDSAGEIFDINEIAQRLLRRGEGRAKPSAARMEILTKAANEIAELLTEPQVVAQLKAVHLDNAGSIVKDFIGKAEDYSKNLLDILDEAWVTMHLADDLSEAARMETVRKFFRKFVLTSNIMRIEGGPIAEALFRASAMLFADGGKVPPPGKIWSSLSKTEQDFYNLLREDEFRLFREALTRYYRYADLPAAPLGREGMAPPKPKAQAAAQEALDVAMELYAKHMDELARVEATGDLDLIKVWEKDMRKIQSQLNKARDKAWTNWVQTYHWHPVEGWIRSEQFNHAKALSAAEQAHAVYVAGKRGVADRELLMADTVPALPPHRILNKAEKAKFLKKHRLQGQQALIDNATSIVDDVSRNVADEVENGALDLAEFGGADKMMISAQNIAARSIKEATDIRVPKVTVPASYKDRLPSSVIEFNRLYRPMLDENTPVFMSDRIAAKTKLLAERWAATTRGTEEAITVLRGQESMATQVTADYVSAVDDLVRYMRDATPDDIDAVWTSLRDDVPIAADGPARQIDLASKLERLVNVVLRSEATSILAKEKIDGAELSKMFARFGLTDDIGFPSARELEGKTPEELVRDLFNQLPFGSTPPKFKPGSVEAVAWAKNREKFRKSEIPAPLVFSRMFGSIQRLKAEQGIAHQVVAQFGWKAHFPTMEAAIKEGWVEVEAVGPQNIARFLPDAEGGNLFHPSMAEGMGRMFRQWNDVYESKSFGPFLRGSMQLLGTLKFTQTTARPGHHAVNLLGDSSTMLIFGGTKIGPQTLFDGADLATRFTKINFAADYAQWGKDFEAKTRRLVGSLNAMPDAKMPSPVAGNEIKLTFYKDGKPVTRTLDREELSADLGRRGVFVGGFVQADIMGATNEIMLTGTTAGNKQGLAKIWSKVARPGHEVMRALSNLTAAYSNVIRGTTAMRVAQSRAWNSYEEMMNAILKEVNLIHPTVQSLASAERKWGRLLFTYYTWLRVAHNALWDMAINHTGMLLAAPKAQYNYALSQGFDPQSPAVPIQDPNQLPDYLSYSVYGPTEMGPQGPRTYRPPLMALDVLDFWKVWYDPSKSAAQNALEMGGQIAGNVVGPSLNILGQPILRAVTDTPGGPRTPGEVVEDAVSNLGFMNLLTGIGAYTPYRYRRQDTTNPLTEADRQRLLQNWLTGARAQDLFRPINEKLGQSQYGSRVKQYTDRIQQENQKKVQSFVDDKLSEGYTKEQILDMLRQMGVN